MSCLLSPIREDTILIFKGYASQKPMGILGLGRTVKMYTNLLKKKKISMDQTLSKKKKISSLFKPALTL